MAGNIRRTASRMIEDARRQGDAASDVSVAVGCVGCDVDCDVG
jgi:hypothetical protein